MAHDFPGYRTVERLHAGDRSIVDRAYRVADARTVIVKQPTGKLVSAEAHARLAHELEMLRAARGPGVVEALEVIRDGGHAALVVEDVGAALASSLGHRRFGVAEALDVAAAIARSLAHIHAAGVVHKDINPSNLVYDPATRGVKVIDFDAAARTGDASARGRDATAEGTLHYLAPEQTGRLERTVDERADLYALGITLYELFTGRRPFDGDNALALIHAHLAEQPRRIDDADPAIPGVIGDIAHKLIAKAPEQRYQTAAGVLADLERCRRELADIGAIGRFAIARHDGAARLEFADRLYGREPEVRALLDAYDRTAQGGVETVFVSGYAGVGKTSVARELVAPVTARRGHLAAGKFEQLNRDVPFSAVMTALEQLVARILAEPAIDRWRAAIAAALGDDAALARTVLPAIERVLGPQPPAPVLDPDAAGRRLALAMARLVQVFARKAHPLVLFLDNMQWADKASLQLLTQLVTSEDTEALLVIAAYRDSGVDAAHPLALAMREYRQRGARVSQIDLAPLTLAQTAELVADALRLPRDQIGDAAAVIWRKTEGNPFFIRQFVQALYDDGCIAFDATAHAFTLDARALDRVAITENVADLLARQLGKLPAATRAVLVTAAAIGTEFDLATLATVGARDAAELRAALAPAVAAGMIHEVAGAGRYRFQHDRIQQVAYEAVPPDARERLHLGIGRQLLSAAPDELDARLFAVVHHLHLGLALIDDAAERARFVELAIEVGRRARRSGAFDVAAAALRGVCAVLDGGAHHARWFAAHLELAQVLSLGGLHREARDVVRLAYPHASDRERATLGALDVTICANLGAASEALACGRRAAALLGVELPTDPAEIERQVASELAVILAAVAERPIESWIDLPVMTDPETLATTAILINCTAPAYQREPALMALLAAKLVTLSLRHGNCSASAHGYGTLAITLWGMGHGDTAYRFGKLGVAVAHRLDARAHVPSVEFMFAAFAAPWRLPIEDVIELLRSTVTRALEVGDLVYAGYAIVQGLIARMVRGERLDDLIDHARRYRKICMRLGLHDIAAVASWYIAHAQAWTGSPPGPDEAAIDLAAIERSLANKSRAHTGLALCRILLLERRFWSGDLAGVVELARAIGPINDCTPGNLYNAEVRLYVCLAAIAVDRSDGDGPGDLRALAAAYRDDLARYAGANPAGFRHMAALVDAELARARGDVGAAIAMYDTAIEAAADNGFVKLEAIAHELAARFWLERAKPAFAAVHLAKARDLCQHWGARIRARELELRRRQLGAATERDTTSRSTSAITSTLDFATVLKASQALATDMVLDSLLARMMEIIIENTGAQAGSIVLDTGGARFVHASKAPGAAVTVGGRVALAAARDVSEGIVNYALRTAECVVLGDATRHPTFRSDPYVRQRRPRSVLCLPIAHKERMIGAVYLENNLVADAFTVERLDALGILVAQLAVSIENAMIFAHLEELVAERTSALTAANHQLRVESTARERMESQLRLAQKLQSVGQLAAGIAHEINTPMQYIGDNIAFLDDALRSLLTLVESYRGTIGATADPPTAAAVHRLEDEHDLEYLRVSVPEACANARDGVQRVSQIVTAMKTFSHPDQREQSPIVLAAALENTLTVAQNEYRHVADVFTDFAALPDVVCHRGELNQVFLNLIVNAAHAIREVVKQRGGRGLITVRTRRDGPDTIVVSVADTGGGIPEAIRDRVFDPFFTTKEVGQGTGQGLALARTAIVDRHGGTISFETRIGEGTTFFVRLPIHGWSPGKPVAAAS
jgi:histidine kinase